MPTNNTITIATSPGYLILDDSHIESIEARYALDLIGDELTVDDVTVVCRIEDADKNKIQRLKYGAQFVWQYYPLQRSFVGYFKSIERVGKCYYKIVGISAIGLISNQYHRGGIYTGQTFSAVLADIIDGAFVYTVDPMVASQAVYGWLPYQSKRENLHQLLFALGVAMRRELDGDIKFEFLPYTTIGAIQDKDITFGGSVDYRDSASRVEVAEYSFRALPTDETVTLFDNTDGSGAASSTLVVFDKAPIHDPTASAGLTINSSNPNYAIVTGTGTLTGKAYTRVEKSVEKSVPGAAVENSVSVSGFYLVNAANSLNVASRVLSYYSSAKTVSAQIRIFGLSCGDLIRLNDPFGDPTTSYIKSMQITPTGDLVASCELIDGYVPAGQGNNFAHTQLITGVGELFADYPAIVADILAKDEPLVGIALIGGGQGGEDGADGTSGTGYNALTHKDGEAGLGGAGGLGGRGGNVFYTVIDLSQYAELQYATGAGGIHGGGNGGATTLGTFSSADGAPNDAGYSNPIDSTLPVYALSGTDGGAGANGGAHYTGDNDGDGRDVIVNGVTYHGGGEGGYESHTSVQGHLIENMYGGGGGAAYGNNGAPGHPTDQNDKSAFGGNGANAIAVSNATTYGCGGNGGYGGGGGGAGGNQLRDGEKMDTYGGSGGSGGLGGKGADGCIFLIW